MNTIMFPKDIDANKITFSAPKALDSGGKNVYVKYDGDKPLIFQTGLMTSPFGIKNWNKDENSPSADKFTLELSFDRNKKNHEHLYNFFEKLEDHLVNVGIINSTNWLKKKFTEDQKDDFRETKFTPVIKQQKDSNTTYPPAFRVTLPSNNGKITCEVYNKSKEPIDILQVETKKAKIAAIVHMTGVWIAGSKYGATLKVIQLLVDPPSSMDDFAFSLDEGNQSDKEESDDVIEDNNHADTSDDDLVDEDVSEEEEEEEVIEETPPPPIKVVKATRKKTT